MRNLWVLALTGLIFDGLPSHAERPIHTLRLLPPPTNNIVPGWWAYEAGERYRLQGKCKESLAMYREALS